jgi:chromosome segregation ATPase
MTNEEHEALRAIVREEIATAEQRIIATTRAAIRASEEATAANIGDVRSELHADLASLAASVARLETRAERTELNISAILTQLAGINRALTAADVAAGATAGELAGIRRTVDQLAAQLADARARIEALERKAS